MPDPIRNRVSQFLASLVGSLLATKSNVLFGRRSSGSGVGEEIDIGTSLTISGTTMDVNFAADNTWAGLQTFGGGFTVNGASVYGPLVSFLYLGSAAATHRDALGLGSAALSDTGDFAASAALADYLLLSGASPMTGSLDLGGQMINNVDGINVNTVFATDIHASNIEDAMGNGPPSFTFGLVASENVTAPQFIEGETALGTVVSSATITISGGTFVTAKLTASTACAFTIPAAAEGHSFILYLKQASTTGNGTATFAGVDWGAAGTYAATATAGKMDILSFVSRPNAAGTGWQWAGSALKGQTPS